MAGSMTTVEVTVLTSQNRPNSKTQPALDQTLHLCPFPDLVQPEWKAHQPSNMQLGANALAILTRSRCDEGDSPTGDEEMGKMISKKRSSKSYAGISDEFLSMSDGPSSMRLRHEHRSIIPRRSAPYRPESRTGCCHVV